MSRKNLIVVRAGDCSLHPHWLLGKTRTFDLAVSYYGNNQSRYENQYDFYHEFKGSKWEGLVDFFSKNKDLISQYEYIWMPDDDLLTNSEVIDQFFATCKSAKLDLAQPALLACSFYSWKITLQQQNSLYRLTDFVEIMAPCFQLSCLKGLLSTFELNSSGWGLEWLWANKLKEMGCRMGIVDISAVHHTRPVGSANHGGAKALPAIEMDELLNKFNITPTKPKNIKKIRINKDITSLIKEFFL